MRDLNYDLKQLCRHNRDGSYATQADREHILDLIADQLEGMGFRHMNAHSLKPRHVEKLVERWLAENLSPGTIKNRMSALRWWAQKTGKENIIARSNAAYDIPDRVYVTNVSKARELAVKTIEPLLKSEWVDSIPGGHLKLLHLWPGQIPPPDAVGRVEL